MIHKNCGGKLTVIDTQPKTTKNGLELKRIRTCKKCGIIIISTEIVNGGEMPADYRHRNYKGV